MLVFDPVLIFTPDVGCPFILLNVKEMSVCCIQAMKHLLNVYFVKS